MGEGDWDVIDRVCAEDVVDRHQGTTGREPLKGAVASLRATFPDLTVAVRHQTAEGDTVVSELSTSGTDTAGLFDMPPSNLSMEIG